MPRLVIHEVCHCAACHSRSAGGVVFITAHEWRAHKAIVSRPVHRIPSSTSNCLPTPAPASVDDVAAHVFTETLHDGADLSTASPSTAASVVDELTASISRLTISRPPALPSAPLHLPVPIIPPSPVHDGEVETGTAPVTSDPDRVETRWPAAQFLAMEHELETVAALLREPSLATVSQAQVLLDDLSAAFRAQKRCSAALNETRDRLRCKFKKAAARVDELGALLEPDMMVIDDAIPYNCSESVHPPCLALLFNSISDHLYEVPASRANSLAPIALLIGLVVQVFLRGSHDTANFIFTMARILVGLAMCNGEYSRTLNTAQENILAGMPANVHDALAMFDLKGQCTVWAACPACHCTYEPVYHPGSDDLVYPSLCSNRPTPESGECGTALLNRQPSRDGTEGYHKLLRPFVHYEFDDYISSLLSDPDNERDIDSSCDVLMDSIRRGDPLPETMHGPFDARFLREFEFDADRRLLFVDRGAEARLVFALAIDFFNVEGLRLRGATTSCGIISLACLNLLPERRYRPENLYLAIIPGPREPHLTESNHYIRPLANDLVRSWQRGTRHSRTALAENRVSRSAVAVAVMDLPAARQASQLAGHKADIFCTCCDCWSAGKGSCARIDWWNWQKRDPVVMRKQAECWRTAASQESHF